MRQTGAGPLLDVNRLSRLRAYRTAQPAPGRDEAAGATAFVPFAGLRTVEDDLAPSREHAELREMLAALERVVNRSTPVPAPGARVLATVLFTDIVDSTRRAAALGDGAWRRTLDRHDE